MKPNWFVLTLEYNPEQGRVAARFREAGITAYGETPEEAENKAYVMLKLWRAKQDDS